MVAVMELSQMDSGIKYIGRVIKFQIFKMIRNRKNTIRIEIFTFGVESNNHGSLSKRIVLFVYINRKGRFNCVHQAGLNFLLMSPGESQ